MTNPSRHARWRKRLSALMAQYHVPGAAMGILRVATGRPDEIIEVASGVLSRATRVAATPDSLFHIGSITKAWTASLVMRLVDQGKVDLDTPVRRYLPDLALSDPDATNAVTLRQLLAHTSGIDGDHWADFGRGDDAVEKYVASLEKVPISHAPGSLFSYSNAGYVLAGRVVEVMSGMSWDEALRTSLCRPLGLTDTVTDPRNTTANLATGHQCGPAGAPVASAAISRAIGPAGIISSTVRDLLRFAGLHLTGGLALDGTRVLSEHSVDVMRSVQVRLPDDREFPDAWGLGWALSRVDDVEVAGHDGNISDQAAFLRIVPEAGLAIAILTNVADASELGHALIRDVLADELGVRLPPRPAPAAGGQIDELSPDWLGRYERTARTLTVSSSAAGLVLIEQRSQADTERYPITPTGLDSFLAWNDASRTWMPGSFTVVAGRRFLHFALRATPESER
ncbi:MAG TPA: serine hydrolase domain-containing protein [Pseudonocardiaceae bacterium]|nr:serine hydrolase domain-containing protein [Pseudonocardiaceae bacterium]